MLYSAASPQTSPSTSSATRPTTKYVQKQSTRALLRALYMVAESRVSPLSPRLAQPTSIYKALQSDLQTKHLGEHQVWYNRKPNGARVLRHAKIIKIKIKPETQQISRTNSCMSNSMYKVAALRRRRQCCTTQQPALRPLHPHPQPQWPTAKLKLAPRHTCIKTRSTCELELGRKIMTYEKIRIQYEKGARLQAFLHLYTTRLGRTNAAPT